MRRFKIGQRVAFVGGLSSWPGSIDPKVNEVVTIEKYCDAFLFPTYYLKEYPVTMIGEPQVFREGELRELTYESNASTEVLIKFSQTEEKADITIKEPQEL